MHDFLLFKTTFFLKKRGEGIKRYPFVVFSISLLKKNRFSSSFLFIAVKPLIFRVPEIGALKLLSSNIRSSSPYHICHEVLLCFSQKCLSDLSFHHFLSTATFVTSHLDPCSCHFSGLSSSCSSCCSPS